MKILTIFFAIISMVAKAQPCINSEANAVQSCSLGFPTPSVLTRWRL
ncbi:MAG: hypothetical protein J5676_12675 [Bacteroidaceae bacterium]|nr:hypothetical protein [Bacteroidaceae bacterium]